MNQKKFESNLHLVKQTIERHLFIEDDSVIDVILAAHVANQFKGDPLWLLLIAPSSSAKTELLRSLDGHPSVYFLSSLTASTLISGMKQKKDLPAPSLLPLLNDRTLIMKDFTSVLSMKWEARTEILAQLREVFDGKYSKAFGTGQRFEWTGKVGLIAACTPVYDKFHAVISAMGDRFLIYRAKNGDSIDMGDAAIRGVGQETGMRAEIQSAVILFIDSVFGYLDSLTPKISKQDRIKLINIAAFCGMGRCPVERDGRDQNVLYQPEIEGPGRLVKQLLQMAIALTVIQGKDQMDEKVFSIVQKIGRDLLPVSRLRILEFLWNDMSWETFGTSRTTTDVAAAVNLPTQTTKMILEDLMITGALNRHRQESAETAPYRWQLKKTICDYITRGGVFGPPF